MLLQPEVETNEVHKAAVVHATDARIALLIQEMIA